MAKPSTKKKSNNTNKTKKHAKTLNPDAVAMKQQKTKTQQTNPFDSIWSRRKFDVLGKKRKGEERRIGLARSKAIDKRKRTLLKEYEQSTKASVFVDKRIGELNDELGEFDKAILRSQREHQLKLGKKSKYNLSDGEDEDDFEIGSGGHLGAGEWDDFEDDVPGDFEDEDGPGSGGYGRKAAILKQLSDPNAQDLVENEGNENRHKSKKEVMQEIILKSKFFKAQKSKDKEENEQLMEELDENFASLVQSNAMVSLTEPGKINSLKALVNKNTPKDHVKKDEISVSQNTVKFQEDQPDHYDKLVKEMQLDMRARPSDRIKTPEEIAQEEKEKLEEMEEERKKRMLAADDSSDEEKDLEKPSTHQLRPISGDDLGDSFSVEEERGTKKGWVDEILERRDADGSDNETDDSPEDLVSEEEGGDEEESDGDDEESEKTLSTKDWEQSDDDDIGEMAKDEEYETDDDGDGTDNDEEEMEQRRQKKAKSIDTVSSNKKHIDMKETKQKKECDKQPSDPNKTLPALIEAPKTFDELWSLLEKYSNEDIVVLIHRIRVSNAIKLAAENRKKMQVFYGLLLQYFATLAKRKPLNFELLDLLVKPLMEISVEIPYFAAICARQRILRIRSEFCEVMKLSESSCWPSLKTLLLLRLWSMIFPCSDFRHVVMTPAVLLMCEYLMRCPILSGRDVAIGSFLCTMVLSITKHSHKFCPEAIIFLRTLLMAATERKQVLYQDSQFYHLMELKALRPLLCIREPVDEISPLNFFMLMDLPEDSEFFGSDKFRASVLVTVIETLRGFVDTCEELKSFPEIFLPISVLLPEVAQEKHIPNELKDKLLDVAQTIKKKTDEIHILRRPLEMRKKKPVPIKLLNPKFEENFVKGRDYDPDRERAETKKLKKLLRREAKGASRELRKDNYFLHEVKQKEKAQLEEEKAEKYGKARAFLQEQEHAFKSGQLGKGGRKRRR